MAAFEAEAEAICLLLRLLWRGGSCLVTAMLFCASNSERKDTGYLRRFCLKMGMHFAHFGLESGVGVFERIYLFNSKWVREKEKYANSK